MNDQKVIYSEKGNPLLVIKCANFLKASVMKDGKTRYVKAVSYYLYFILRKNIVIYEPSAGRRFPHERIF
jgi:hypothetical protein